jgi:hypothetical protein
MDEEEILESTIYNVTWKWDQLIFGDCNQVSQGTKNLPLSNPFWTYLHQLGVPLTFKFLVRLDWLGLEIVNTSYFSLFLNFRNLAIFKVRENHVPPTSFGQLTHNL